MNSSSELERIYSKRFDSKEAQRAEIWGALAAYFQQWIKPTDTVVDIGAGYCEFINAIRAAKKYALDANPITPLKASRDVSVISMDVKGEWPIQTDSVNVCFSSNFFEHLATKEDLTHCFSEIHRILCPQGLLICMGPNIRYAYREYWDFFDHYLPLSDQSLLECCEINGFRQIRVVPRFLPFTMKKTNLPNPAMLVRLYLRAPVFWRFFGKQFLLVVGKN